MLYIKILKQIQIRKSVVDSFGAQNPPCVPSRLITISAEQGINTVTRLKYCVPLKGINPDDMELYLIRSLGDGKYYIIVYTLYVYLFVLL